MCIRDRREGGRTNEDVKGAIGAPPTLPSREPGDLPEGAAPEAPVKAFSLRRREWKADDGRMAMGPGVSRAGVERGVDRLGAVPGGGGASPGGRAGPGRASTSRVPAGA